MELPRQRLRLPQLHSKIFRKKMQRLDIQALRGIAVLYVVIYHADLGFLKNGFLGVDIFFVISGYLITGMICRELDAGNFSVRKFYWRRAKRLLPATYGMLIVVALLSVFSLTKIEFADFLSQLFGSLTFVSNIILWRQAGYFDVSAEFKPLLHMWSLSIEEQYYLLLPVLLIITSYRYRNKIVFAALLTSLLLCFALVSGHPSASFYLLPTRAWELLIGSMGATWKKPDLFRKGERNLGLFSVAVILVLPVIQIDPIHPRFDALVVCLATLIALETRPTILQNNLLAAALGKVGDISFSLYLVHWPLFALVRNIYIGELPTGLKVGNRVAIDPSRRGVVSVRGEPHTPFVNSTNGFGYRRDLFGGGCHLGNSCYAPGCFDRPTGLGRNQKN